MSESGGEGPKGPDRKNVHSIVDAIQHKKSEQNSAADAEWSTLNKDLIDTSQFKDPERVRRTGLDKKASLMLDTLRADHAVSAKGIAAAQQELQTQKAPPDYDALIESLTHEECVREPDRSRAIVDGYFKGLDNLVAPITDQESAEEDIGNRFARENMSQDEWAREATRLMDEDKAKRARDTSGSTHPSERRSFTQQLASASEETSIASTERIVSSVRAYSLKEWGPAASSLLAVVQEYKKRRAMNPES